MYLNISKQTIVEIATERSIVNVFVKMKQNFERLYQFNLIFVDPLSSEEISSWKQN